MEAPVLLLEISLILRLSITKSGRRLSTRRKHAIFGKTSNGLENLNKIQRTPPVVILLVFAVTNRPTPTDGPLTKMVRVLLTQMARCCKVNFIRTLASLMRVDVVLVQVNRSSQKWLLILFHNIKCELINITIDNTT